MSGSQGTQASKYVKQRTWNSVACLKFYPAVTAEHLLHKLSFGNNNNNDNNNNDIKYNDNIIII